MKAKITKLMQIGSNIKTAVATGTFQGKTIELGLTTGNTSWATVVGKKVVKLGDEIEIDDNDIQSANDPATGKANGRYFVQRLTANKFAEHVKMAQLLAQAESFTV